MLKRGEPVIKDSKEDWTRISFVPDFEKFQMEARPPPLSRAARGHQTRDARYRRASRAIFGRDHFALCRCEDPRDSPPRVPFPDHARGAGGRGRRSPPAPRTSIHV